MGWESVYDSEKGTFLGRTAMSWIKILGFYAIYYTLLGLLFWGSVKVGMIRIKNENIFGMDRGRSAPVIRTRTSQPGVDAWPHNMIREDNEGREFELATYEKDSVTDTYPLYVQKLEEFLMDHCPFENECSFTKIIGPKWNETIDFVVVSEFDATKDAVKKQHKCTAKNKQSRRCLVWTHKCKQKTTDENNKDNSNCGKIMKIDHDMLKKNIADDTTKQINKPYFFIALNKVIGFNLIGYSDLEEMVNVNAKPDRPSPTLRYDPKDFVKNENLTLTQEKLYRTAFVNCYVFDTEAIKNKCKPWKEDGSTDAKDDTKNADADKVSCDNMKAQSKYQIDSIKPYIVNDNYKYAGYLNDTLKTEESDIEAALYAKPFAMFQMSVSDSEAKIANKEDQSLIRCNVIAQNIQYPYLDEKSLMGNALLAQPGHGWVQLGFLQKQKEEKDAR